MATCSSISTTPRSRIDDKAALSTNATWLKRWTSTRISIEGHCDERGTAEYNLGLGERRANAVKAYLVELGVPADRIVIVSKGKESPFCTESRTKPAGSRTAAVTSSITAK